MLQDTDDALASQGGETNGVPYVNKSVKPVIQLILPILEVQRGMSRSLWGARKLIFYLYCPGSGGTILTGLGNGHFKWNSGRAQKIYFRRDKSFCMIEVWTYVVETWRLQLVCCVRWSAVVEA